MAAVMARYHINIFFSAEDGGFIADVPDLPNCSTFGDTQESALHEVMKAMDAWMESARNAGLRIPEPRYRPAIYQLPRDGGRAAG